jgi:hypothetical protein
MRTNSLDKTTTNVTAIDVTKAGVTMESRTYVENHLVYAVVCDPDGSRSLILFNDQTSLDLSKDMAHQLANFLTQPVPAFSETESELQSSDQA